MACSAHDLLNQAVSLMSGCPAWLHLEQRGIPTETIEAHQDQLRYLGADIPGRPRGEHALAALIQDAVTSEVIAFQLSFCDPQGGKVARTKQHPPKKTYVLRKGGSLAGLFLIGQPEPGGPLHFVEGRAEKVLAVAAAGFLPVAGFGGRQVRRSPIRRLATKRCAPRPRRWASA
jgi:hypothetical protein